MANSTIENTYGGGVADATVSPSKLSVDFGGFNRNRVVNGNFVIWQRGDTISTPNNASCTADRWLVSYDGTIGTFSISRQDHTVGQTTVEGDPIHFLRWNQTTSGSGSSLRRITQRIENVATFAAKTLHITFYAKADTTRTVSLSVIQNFGSGGSTAVETSAGSVNLTTSWQKFTTNVAVPSTSGKTVGANNFVSVGFNLPINVTFTFDVSQVQVELGGHSPFEIEDIGDTQIKCLRYYQVAPTRIRTDMSTIPFKGVMRAAPTLAGGGTGFTAGLLTEHGATAYQTTEADQTITLDAEL